MYYLKRGFKITTQHVDSEFAPLQALSQEIPGGTRVKLESASEHVLIQRDKFKWKMKESGI